MPLTPGARVGAYEIVAAIGSGGMGVVYRARDTRLGRDVAIKALPDAFLTDRERTARFEREAQILAALNHPNIAGIHGLEEVGGARLLVLEFVDGESLAQRLERGRLSVDEALAIARQIVDALEAAHERAIVHRDLKPANIMLTAEGQVKILDFGLAKVEPGAAESVGPGLTHSPTLTFAATQAGVILGTAAYMSPEQAKGRAADKRSDVWAFGCVMFEILTGRRAFEGDDVSDTLAAILRGEPDWNALPPGVPAHVRTIIKQCVAKDRKARIPDIAVVRFMLDNPATRHEPVPPVPAPPSRRPTMLWPIAAAFFALTTIAGFGAWYAGRSTPRAATRFLLPAPENTEFSIAARTTAAGAVISPDGSKLAFTVRDAAGKVLLWVRPLDSLTAQPLAGTDGASYPFWSPDSRSIAYSTQGKLMRVSAAGGPSQTLCPFSGQNIVGRGGAWTRDDVIFFNNGPGPLFRISSAGGQPSPVVPLAVGVTTYSFPTLLPDERHLLAYGQSGSEEKSGVYVLSVDTGDARRLMPANTGAIYAQEAAQVLFVRQGTLFAQPFDSRRRALSGEPVVVAERVEDSAIPGVLAFSISGNGVLVYGASAISGGLQLNWVDRQGKITQSAAPLANYRGIDLSPDGTRVAAHRQERAQQGDVWVTELTRGTTSRFTFDAAQENSSPVWSPDGQSIAYASLRGGKWGLYRKASNNAGSEEQLFESRDTVLPQSWSPDGQSIVYTQFSSRAPDLWRLPLTGDRKPVVLLDSPFVETFGQVSPDGRWLAYTSNETGTGEVYVQPFGGGSGKWQVSTSGGSYPRWRRDGRELFYLSFVGQKMMAVEITPAGDRFEAGKPAALFDSGFFNLIHIGPYYGYSVSPDGQRFLIAQPPSAGGQLTLPPLVVVINWTAALPK
jgi:Tol biopolymer transport system component